MNCAYCKKELGDHFDLARVKNGERVGVVQVCSLLCLMQWTYNYSVRQGVRGVVGLKTLVGQVVDTLRGKR